VLQPYGEGTAIRLKHKTLGVAEFPIKIQGRLYFYPIEL
jgi:hypothetical protein